MAAREALELADEGGLERREDPSSTSALTTVIRFRVAALSRRAKKRSSTASFQAASDPYASNTLFAAASPARYGPRSAAP
jgi:hypothetical protein